MRIKCVNTWKTLKTVSGTYMLIAAIIITTFFIIDILGLLLTYLCDFMF